MIIYTHEYVDLDAQPAAVCGGSNPFGSCPASPDEELEVVVDETETAVEPEAIVSGPHHETMCLVQTALRCASIEWVAVRFVVLEGAEIETDDSGNRIGLVGGPSRGVTVCIDAVQCGADGWHYQGFDPDDATVRVVGLLEWSANSMRGMRRLKRSTR
jgi:hypothetical protein